MKNAVILLALAIYSSFSTIQAQGDFPFVQGEVLIQLKSGYEIVDALQDLSLYKGEPTDVQTKRQLSRNLNIWQLTFDFENISHSAMLALARNAGSVEEAQLNFILESRVVPNDSLYTQQWQYEQPSDFDLDAEAAWDITTGGVTASGDTIVVCVIDDGVEVSHPDWGDNIWYNHGEIAGNGIDDDGNGYIDDFRGWNADAGTNNILPPNPWNTHGTPVAGIVAAQGNNGVGVSGVNWDVKMMFVVGGGNSSNSIAAYDYPLSCRKLYNQTNGASGAFVVATNASWGVNNQDCATYAPLVNNMYDSLGTAGVLSTAATANANINVDVNGDFPTSCSSDYLITVTNMQQSGTKVAQAGYGATTIDLGAYGAGTYTIATGQSYGGFGGTSGATPHVAGTIGLLYSAPCGRLGAIARNQPQQTALMIKQIILNSTVSNTTLQNITVSGGVLNMKNALDSVMNIGCAVAGCHEPYTISYQNVTGNSADVYWEEIDSTTNYFVQYRAAGATSWSKVTVTDTFALLTGLMACTDYQFQVAADCDSTNYSSIHVFKTGDCCDAPMSVNVVSENLTSASFNWTSNPIATSYTVEHKLKTDTAWSSTTTSANSITLTGLDSCSIYELRIQSSCSINVNNEYTNVIQFETIGCGSCERSGYCASEGGSSNDDWLENVTLGGIDNTTGSNGGYASFIEVGPTTDIVRGDSVPVAIDLGFNLGNWATNWRLKVWIDFNQDEVFDNATELVYSPGLISTPTVNHTGNIFIPYSAELNRTRMRVSLSWGSSNLVPCSDINYGEVEDYCVNIIKSTNISVDENDISKTFTVFPNPFEESIILELKSEKTEEVEILISNLTGQIVKTNQYELVSGQNRITIDNSELSSGLYVLSVHYTDGKQVSKKILKY